MTNLAYRDSRFNDLFDVRRDFDQLFDRFLSTWPRSEGQRGGNGGTHSTLIPPINAYVDKNGKQFHCEVALPGVDPKNVDIRVRGHELLISGERSMANETKEADFVRSELMYGSFERDVLLPEGIDSDKMSAEYRNGMLEITAPISVAALPRHVEIRNVQEAAARR